MTETSIIGAAWILTGFCAFVFMVGPAYRLATRSTWTSLSGVALGCVVFWPLICITWPEVKRDIYGLNLI